MLTGTDQAAAAIRAVTDQPQTPAGAGVRITAEGEHADQLVLRVVPAPGTDDAVIESSGALLFLEPAVAAALDDKALDAHSDADGTLRFTVADQEP
jgi:Fe-S cluster assembly iron-binding protein IscA